MASKAGRQSCVGASARRPAGRDRHATQETVTAFVAAAHTANLCGTPDEAETRKLIDQQPGSRLGRGLCDPGCARRRPEKQKNLAIAEWPTHSGPADYVRSSD